MYLCLDFMENKKKNPSIIQYSMWWYSVLVLINAIWKKCDFIIFQLYIVFFFFLLPSLHTIRWNFSVWYLNNAFFEKIRKSEKLSKYFNSWHIKLWNFYKSHRYDRKLYLGRPYLYLLDFCCGLLIKMISINLIGYVIKKLMYLYF